MRGTPLVSVLMPARNAARHLAPAVGSVLAQTLRPLELIVVDDGSTDETRAVLAAFTDPRLVIVTVETPRGLPHALNRGLSVARADLIARLDADDVARPERLERQLGVMQADPGLVLLGSRAHLIDAAGRHVGRLDRPLGEHAIRWYQLFDNPFVHSSVMFRRGVVRDELGGYDESFLTATEDWQLWSRILRRSRAANLAERLVDYRTHPTSMIGGVDAGRRRADIARIVEVNAASVLGMSLTPHQVHLVSAFLLGLERGEAPAWLSLATRMARVFGERHPAARGAGEPWRTLGLQLDALAARSRPAARTTALAVYAGAVRREPGLLRRLPMSRVLARLALGPRGITLLQAVRSHGAEATSPAPQRS